ncbi:hypothetical protein COOONC_15294 [Cooperia oncophora]
MGGMGSPYGMGYPGMFGMGIGPYGMGMAGLPGAMGMGGGFGPPYSTTGLYGGALGTGIGGIYSGAAGSPLGMGTSSFFKK